ncbi:MAG: hypothetical protein ACHQ1D_01035 [Nitrososphaerales archaeon]
MRLKGVAWIVVLGILILIGKYYMDLYWKHTIGLSLTAWMCLIIIVHLISKAKNKNNPKSEEHAYILPDNMAKKMKLMDMRVQYEASILATVFIIVGMIAFTIYLVFFSDLDNWYKFFIAFNSFWGVIFMGSNLITSYQAYVQYMEVLKITNSGDMMKIR